MDPATVATITQVISSLGFPIFVTVWLLLRTDKLLEGNTKAVEALREAIDRLEDAHHGARPAP